MSLRLNKIFLSGMIIIFLLIFSFAEALAQGKIVGHVKDKKTGEPLIGVNVIIAGTYLGAATDIDGDYTIVNVPIGEYSVKASMVGATTILKTNVVVQTDRITTVDFELEQTTIQGKEVVVTAQRDILHKDVSSSQVVINNKQITEAAGVRTLHDFLSTQAAITSSNYLNIRGGLASETGTVVNGLTFVNQRIGKAESLIPTSAVEEVSLKAGGMSAEYGDFRSGIITVTTKTGTKEGYHGSFSFTRDLAHMKRFGKSLSDPYNNLLRSHLDPDIAFIGVDEAVKQGYITDYDKQQFYNNSSGKGDIFLSNPTLLPSNFKNLTPAITAVDLYLFDAWMHMMNPDWNKLNAKIQELKNSDQISDAEKQRLGSEVTDQNLKNAFANHQYKEGQYADINFDGGFGGPVPLIGDALGDATFYLSNVTNRTSYIQPLELPYDIRSNTMLAIKSNISKALTLKLTALYSYEKGMNPARGADDELPSLGNDIGTGTNNGLDRGVMMPENNIPLFTQQGSGFNNTYWWYNSMLQPYVQRNILIGATITHALSSTTFYDYSISYQRTKDFIDPSLSTMRSNNVLAMIGPIPVNEMPYGRLILPINASSYQFDGFTFDQYSSVPGLSERFDSKGGVVYDHSLTQQLRMKLNFGSQFSKMHFFKAGLEFNYVALNNNRYAYWPGQDYFSAYEYNFKVYPRSFGAYAQDQITFENMIANIGVRMDHYSNGSLRWPTGDPFNTAAFGPTKPPGDWLQILQNGGSITWDRWNAVDAELRAAGNEGLLQPTKTWTVFSPRFGVSFPISDRTKFYFNYGQYRQMPAFSELYFYNTRWDKQGTFNLGNPSMPPIKTIQYELGVDYNLLDEYLIHAAGYYKDISGESRDITIYDNSGVLQYPFRSDDRYRDIEGVEVTIKKNVGDWLTGWVDLQYIYQSSGYTGRKLISENPTTNAAESAFYNDDPSRPHPIPSINANVNLRTPNSWGYYGGGWNFSFLPMWQLGHIFDYNPRNVSGVIKEFSWPDYWMFNMKISKTFDLPLVKATVYVDINNLFNRKVFLYNDAFSDGVGGTDFNNYMKSLHLPQYNDSYYDPIRTATDYQTGNDKIGDLRSADKPYINDPNNDIFTYGNPRQIWFGIRFDF